MENILKAWLYQQCGMLQGSVYAELLWGKLDEGPYSQPIYWPNNQREDSKLARVAQAALHSKKAVIKTRSNKDDGTGAPLDAMACPLFLDGKLLGVVALEMTNRSQSMQQAAVQMVQAGAGWLEAMILLHGATSREQLINLVEMVAAGLENDTFQVAATEVANELSKRFSCQRVSLGFMQRNQIRIEAISHSTTIDRKSNLIGAIRDAMNESVDQQATLVYPARGESDVLVNRCHARLAKAEQGAAICTVPLIRNGEVIGALMLERSDEKHFSPETVKQCEQIGLLIGPLLENRRREERPLPGKILDAFQGWLGKLFGPRHKALKAVAALSAVLLIWLSLANGTARISSVSSLEAAECRVIVASQQGHIAEAHVRAGDLVNAGDLLAKLDDQELQLELRKWQSQRGQLLKEYRKALSGADRAEVTILNAKRAQVEAQLMLVKQKLERTSLYAPFSGVVIKGDLSQSLGSPVERGEILFEVAPTDNYRAVLKVEDRDIGLVSLKQKGLMKLSGLPDQTIGIEVDRITPIASSGDGRNYFRVEAKMDSHSDLMRPGMEGVAKIEVGQEKLLWIWSRRLVEWLQLFVWNRLP